MSDLERAEQTWDNIDIEEVRAVAWLCINAVGKDIWGEFSDGLGPVHRSMELLSQRRPGDNLVGAALVCGDMQSERAFFEHTPFVKFARVEGYDLSQASLDRYTPDGIEWVPHKVDCNNLDLPKGEYDFVVASHGAHHVMNLSGFFAQARRSLKPGGLMYIYEWIGPVALNVPRRNRLFAKVLLISMFPRRRSRRTHMGLVKGLRYIHDIASPADPSEACNSLALYPEFERNFNVLAEYHHGAIAYPMFEGLAQNMKQDQPRTRRRLELAVKIERWLTKFKLVHPLFVVAVGERKPD